MEGIYFTQKKIENEGPETYACSKFLGTLAIPQGLLHNKDGEFILTDADYFVMQLNLADIADRETLLPKEGMLYFFVDVDDLKPKVIFAKDISNCKLEVYDDINDGFDRESYGETDGYRLVFDKSLDDGHYVLGDVDPDLDLETDIDIDGYVTLLEIDYLALPNDNMLNFGELAPGDGHYIFLIKEDDLKKCRFSRVKLVDKED